MRKKSTSKITKIPNPVVWAVPGGKLVAVQAPFPHGFCRSLTCKTLAALRVKFATDPGDPWFDIMSRPEATKGFALTHVKYIIETNTDWGPVSL